MRLWSSRPGYANLTPSSASSQPLSAQPEKGSAPQAARPRSATLDRIRDKKVSFAPDAEADDHESLLGESEGRPQQQQKGLKPSFPSLHSNKRMSFSLDAIKLRNGKTGASTSSLTRSPAKSTPISTPAAGKAKSAPSSASKAAKQADAVLCLISGQDISALSATSGGETGKQQTKVVSAKELSQLKSALVKPKEANKIIDELKKIPVSTGQAAEEDHGAQSPTAAMRTLHVKGACLDCTDAEVLDKSQTASQVREGERTGTSDHLAKGMTARMNGIPSAGTMLGQMASSAGAFEALAGVTGKMIDASGAHNGVVTPPTDRISILVYWWGYELVLPPPSIRYLASVHSVTGTAFTFLQALTVGGGVPELAPFIRYLSMYLDMEWKAIQQNDKGKGVVLAATWVLPVAVVPRPMAF